MDPTKNKAIRVLVVEDEDDHYELIARGFERQTEAGVTYRLERAKTLREGLAQAQAQPPDLVISDWKLPDGDGIELVSRNEDGELLFPVVIMTSHGNEAWAVEAMRLGALDYVVKSPEMLAEMARISGRALREWNGIAERKRLEGQLRQAQKMEAVGHLAGGIAHDFNNILTAIIGYGSLLDSLVPTGSELKPLIEPILTSAQRAADLTRQILAFSRKQMLAPKETDVNGLIAGMQKLIFRLIGEDISVTTHFSDQPLPVLVDPGQIEQVLMNLCTNARDAMPDGGLLSVTTSIVDLDAHDVTMHNLNQPGPYALITLSDTGRGMDEATRQRIFEPFFTTKEVGKGTGLGLSIVYGIIKQHNGEITVYSEPGVGATFKIYLPLLTTEGQESRQPKSAPPPPQRGTETVLVAEDNADVMGLVKRVLEDYGYTVINAIDGEDAICQFTAHQDQIHLALLDVVMPKKSGKEVCDAILQLRPDMKVLFMSGYTADIISTKGILKEGAHFVAKPVSPRDLLFAIRQVLDGEGPSGA